MPAGLAEIGGIAPFGTGGRSDADPILRLVTFFRTQYCGIVGRFIPGELLGIVRHLNRGIKPFTDVSGAIGTAVGVILKEQNLSFHTVPVDPSCPPVRLSVEIHPGQTAVVDIAVTGIIAVNADHAVGEMTGAAREQSAHELFAA